MKHDISTPEDIDLLVGQFYKKLIDDEMLGYLFTDIMKTHLAEHLPIIASFWKFILLDIPGYKRNSFAPHLTLHQQVPLNKEHFDRWLKHFNATVNELFEGIVAEKAKQQANIIALTMLHKLS